MNETNALEKLRAIKEDPQSRRFHPALDAVIDALEKERADFKAMERDMEKDFALRAELERIEEQIRAQKGWLISEGEFGERHTYDEWADALRRAREGE